MNLKNIDLALAVRDLLRERNARLVTAESCTAGQIAATLACVPGMSQWLCGGFVVYRSTSKADWLGIPRQILDDPKHGPVSPLASRLLCDAALAHTPDATCSLAITGDVGPGAPASTDGVCFVAVRMGSDHELVEAKIQLTCPTPRNADDIPARVGRLDEATGRALELLLKC